jgi:hypothetical protein
MLVAVIYLENGIEAVKEFLKKIISSRRLIKLKKGSDNRQEIPDNCFDRKSRAGSSHGHFQCAGEQSQGK